MYNLLEKLVMIHKIYNRVFLLHANMCTYYKTSHWTTFFSQPCGLRQWATTLQVYGFAREIRKMNTLEISICLVMKGTGIAEDESKMTMEYNSNKD